MSDVAAIVLAAGASVRMGRNKLLLELGGETVVGRAARTAKEAGMDPVVVVTGHEREAVEAALHGLDCRTVFNPDHAAGQHTSLRAGIAALGNDPAAAMVALADMPFVTAAMMRTVADRYHDTGAPLVLSRYGGETVAPPMLYDRRLFGELLDVDRRCGRAVARRHRAAAVVVDWPGAALRDLDHPDDYTRVLRDLGAPAAPATAPAPARGAPTPSAPAPAPA